MKDEGMNGYDLFGGLNGVRQEGICFERDTPLDGEKYRRQISDLRAARQEWARFLRDHPLRKEEESTCALDAAEEESVCALDAAIEMKEKEEQDKATEERLMDDIEAAGLHLFRSWSKKSRSEYEIEDLKKMALVVQQKWFKDFIARRDKEYPGVEISLGGVVVGGTRFDNDGNIWIDVRQSEEEIKRFLLGKH